MDFNGANGRDLCHAERCKGATDGQRWSLQASNDNSMGKGKYWHYFASDDSNVHIHYLMAVSYKLSA